MQYIKQHLKDITEFQISTTKEGSTVRSKFEHGVLQKFTVPY